MSGRSSTGTPGVYYTALGLYNARTTRKAGRTRKSLGTFKTLDEAIKAMETFERTRVITTGRKYTAKMKQRRQRSDRERSEQVQPKPTKAVVAPTCITYQFDPVFFSSRGVYKPVDEWDRWHMELFSAPYMPITSWMRCLEMCL